MKFTVVALLLLMAQGTQKRGEIKTSVDKSMNFAAITTYAWEKGSDAFDRDIHRAIVQAIDQELAARGLRKVEQKADVTVAYFAMGSTEINLNDYDKAKGKEVAPAKSVGSLAIAMYRQPDRTRVWSAQTREYVDVSPEARDATARAFAARLFESLPRARKN